VVDDGQGILGIISNKSSMRIVESNALDGCKIEKVEIA
jgi:hypothetical protein